MFCEYLQMGYPCINSTGPFASDVPFENGTGKYGKAEQV